MTDDEHPTEAVDRAWLARVIEVASEYEDVDPGAAADMAGQMHCDGELTGYGASYAGMLVAQRLTQQ